MRGNGYRTALHLYRSTNTPAVNLAQRRTYQPSVEWLSVLSGVSRRARAFTGYIDAAGSSGAGESSYVWDMCYLRRMKYCDSRDRKEGTLLSLRNGSHCSCKQCWKRSRPSLAERASGVAPSPS
ncbi:hypothetical protein Q8A67_019752 [Cirrhinus molitorella]|uniref:Uncharacterized protein n=1 Tax=Cirrhinus molitorella TaxID=172907 RepID=A0AA88PCZ8_9TELE|nr:hypothetical protein Q8A67_019752 [Cirrhinus molitorella]